MFFDVLLFVEHKNKKSQERSADSKTIQKLLLWFWPELPFAARMEDDASFVTLGALFGTARLRSRLHRNHEILSSGCLHALQTTHSLPDGSYERYGHGWHAGRVRNSIKTASARSWTRLRSSGAVETLCVNGAIGAYRSFCMRVRDRNSYVCASLSTPNTTRW